MTHSSMHWNFLWSTHKTNMIMVTICSLGFVALASLLQWGGDEFKSKHRQDAYHHSPPNYGERSNDLVNYAQPFGAFYYIREDSIQSAHGLKGRAEKSTWQQESLWSWSTASSSLFLLAGPKQQHHHETSCVLAHSGSPGQRGGLWWPWSREHCHTNCTTVNPVVLPKTRRSIILFNPSV